MKHTRLYLGITTAMLTIAGVAATRVHRSVPVSIFFATSTPVASNCWPAPDAQYTKDGTGPRGRYCVTVGEAVGCYLIYTDNTCFTPAKLRNN